MKTSSYEDRELENYRPFVRKFCAHLGKRMRPWPLPETDVHQPTKTEPVVEG